jgi:capsular polysaccharide transport system ATP-binding protein
MIEIENVSKFYPMRRGRHVVLDGVNLHIRRGERLGVIGRNGAGKSTLLRLIGGIEPPSAGRVRRAMSVSWPLAYSGAFQQNLTGLDNLRFICRIYGVDYRAVLPFVQEFTELGSFIREPVDHYSSGMRARLAFALSLAIEFDCYLIDEVIVVGDVRFHDKCRTELFEKRADRTLILVSHDLETIKAHCDTAIVVHAGKVVRFDDVEKAQAFYLSTLQ